MSQNTKTPNPNNYQEQLIYYGEISLVDIYLTIKRNRKLFFSIIVLSFLISLTVTYFKAQLQPQQQTEIIEHVLIIEIGSIFGENAGQRYIDQPINTIEKIKNIYLPKLNQAEVTAEHIERSALIVLKAIQTNDKINYNKLLLTLASHILKDHNSALNLNSRVSVKPTKIIQQPTKRIVESKSKSKSKSKLLIPIFGIILGIFLAFFVVIISEFIKKVKQAESEIETS